MEKNKLELYDIAKDAYYNGDEPIMSDQEFDELESELGLENVGYIGSKSKNYTIPHPFIMGSISKVQVKYYNKNTINFAEYADKVNSYLLKSRLPSLPGWGITTTPKYDGCSFEIVMNHKGEFVSASTRGDGNYGKDISVWFTEEWKKNFEPRVEGWLQMIDEDSRFFLYKLVVRGECLVRKDVFAKKYSNDFTIPRSFVSGVLNQDWEGTPKQIEMRDDIDWICYDYREVYDNGVVTEVDYNGFYLPGVSCDFNIGYKKLLDHKSFHDLYITLLNYRDNMCPYCLDGFVIKPFVRYRLNDNTRTRQEDCVAVKFTPEIVETEIIRIEWNVGKTGEYFPTGIVKEVILGGKKVSRVSLHNLDYVNKNRLGVGAKVSLRLSGDIIPDVLDVLIPAERAASLPEDSYITKDENSGCLHLMKHMTDEDKCFIDFLNSVKVLKIDGIGDKVAERIWMDVYGTFNILDFMTDENLDLISNIFGKTQKSTQNIVNALRERRKTLTLPDVIESCGFENCGPKNSLWLAKKLSGIDAPNDGIPQTIIKIYEDRDKFSVDNLTRFTPANRLKRVMEYVKMFNIPMLKEESTNQIPVILTGEPSDVTSYRTKKDWLLAHPQYKETSKWSECKILFTNDLNSNTGKMSKAKKSGVEIRLYEE